MKHLLALLFLICAGTLALAEPIEHDLKLLRGKDSGPLTEKLYLIMDTDLGEILIEVYPEAAPNAAKRFVALAESGYFDDTPVSRVVKNFVAQFGINWREPHREWKEMSFDDDPTLYQLERGTLAFAKAGPNTNSTQVFINLRENNSLAAPEYNFTTFGKVVEGMDIVDQFVRVGDPSGGLSQGRLWSDGDAYLKSLVKKPTMIKSVRLRVDESEDDGEKTKAE